MLDTEIETAELAEPPAGGVTVLGEKLTLTSGGCPSAVSVTGEFHPSMEVMATVAEVDPPAAAVTLEGLTEMPKSPGWGCGVTCSVKS